MHVSLDSVVVMFHDPDSPLQRKMAMAHCKRARKFGTVRRFVYLGTQLWKYDWHRYASPKDRPDLWDGIMINVFTCARVGEYIESTARENSGRGLYYRVRLLQVDVTRIPKLTSITQNAEFTSLTTNRGKPEFGL